MEIQTATAEEWLGVDRLPAGLTIREIMDDVKLRASQKWPNHNPDCSMAKRWPGYDPRPDVDEGYGIIEVYVWKTIVDDVQDPATEVAYSQLPLGVQARRRVGHPWYVTLAHVLLRGANLEARPPDQRGLNTIPMP